MAEAAAAAAQQEAAQQAQVQAQAVAAAMAAKAVAAQQQQQVAQQAAVQEADAAQAARAAQAATELEGEILALLRKDLLSDDGLDSAEDARLESLWKVYPELCDRLDDQVEAEAEAVGTSPPASPPPPAAQGEYAEVVCPDELSGARTMRIAMPDGRQFDVQVPEGLRAGDKFTVGPFPPA